MNTGEDLEPPVKKVRQARVSNNGIFSTSSKPIKESGVVLGSGGSMGGRNEKILLSLFLINERKGTLYFVIKCRKKTSCKRMKNIFCDSERKHCY